MDFTLIHAGLAAGAALAALPVVLHLMMRQTPKRLVFPALRLLQQRHLRSTKRLRIKNWLLLLARMALIALMALALARPSLNAKVPLGDGEVPTALALVIDTSLSMGYVSGGKTRLEEAKEVAGRMLRRLPDSSQVFVIDSGVPSIGEPVSPSAARTRLDRLELRPANRPLNQSLERAYEALAESRRDLARVEAYVFTDLARTAWDADQPVPGRERVREESGREVATIVISVAAPEPVDTAIVALEARPATDADPSGRRPFEVAATVRNVGPAGARLAEFVLDGKVRGRREVELPADGQEVVTFRTSPNLGDGVHQAEVRLSGGADDLAFDDRRFVTFEVSPAFQVLIVYDPDADAPTRTIDATFLAKALDPRGDALPFAVETLGTNQFGDRFPRSLEEYACVFLNNVAELPEACWEQLASYVGGGGGLVVGLGENVDAAHYRGDAARGVLSGTVGEAVTREEGTAFGTVRDVAHPLFAELDRELSANLALVPVWTYWEFEPAESGASRVLLEYQDGAPALVESIVGGERVGRVLIWTTPLSRRTEPGDPDAWNEFPYPDFWSYLVLMRRSVPYLAGASGTRLNYLAGQTVVLPLERGNRARGFLVEGPGDAPAERLNLPRQAREIVVEGLQSPGHRTLTPTGSASADAEDREGRLAFSVNVPAEQESSFATLEDAELDLLLGDEEGNYAVAESPDELERTQALVQIGRELFPWLIAAILVLLTAENYLANRFHRRREAPAAQPIRAGSGAAA